MEIALEMIEQMLVTIAKKTGIHAVVMVGAKTSQGAKVTV